MDDGGGAFISWEALSLVKDLGKYFERRDGLSSDLLTLYINSIMDSFLWCVPRFSCGLYFFLILFPG